MPAKPRSEVIDPDVVGVYHCWNILVRSWFLFGLEWFTGRDYSYRKDWFRDQIKRLAGSMAIDVLDYAILDSHYHIILRNRPDIVRSWSDEEVCRRWWYVCPDRKNKDGSTPEPKRCEIQLLLEKVDEYRSRLSDISWMLRLACQRIAIRSNKEEDQKGRFFAKRFECERLETVADVLACSLYVDLNLIRAGICQTPEDSKYTSAYDRIRARWLQVQRELGSEIPAPGEEEGDAWLAPIYLDERAEAYTETPRSGSLEGANISSSSLCNPIGAARVSDKGFLPLTLEKYLMLLDSLGRIVRPGKRGFIPSDLRPILERLKLGAEQPWLDSVSLALTALIKHDPLAATGGPASIFG